MTQRFHLFPFRTQKLSSVVPKILGWRRPGKIGRRRLFSSLYSYMARWSSGQDGGLSRRKREFDSPTGHHVGMDYIPFKKPSHSAGLFSYHFVIPPFPHKTLQGKFLRGPRCRGKTNAPAEWTAFHSKTQTIGWAFLVLFRHSSSSHKTLQGKFLRGPYCRGEDELFFILFDDFHKP